ncbi:guanylate kinase [Nodosilinea sp. LEGE 07298]|uniref:guanylate kinase n=1 Tax=Nodosilinea sp. LEGE 07298 TaxID=2777970 RepID=UPI001D152C4E|nr:guanylate kinase [Nodosilinea sp. LEGE 07298]
MTVSSPAPLNTLSLDTTPDLAAPRLGRLIVFTGPSGVGKGTLLRSLRHRYPMLKLSVSATTRSPRPGEVDGQDYFFVSREAFLEMVERGELLEWAEFAGNFYGTPKTPVMQAIEAGHWVILEIELEGARQVRETFPNALQLFVLPPSIEELESRIRLRGKDADEAIARRLQRAQVEIDAASEFDEQIVNDDLEVALQQLENAIFKD